MKQQLAAQPEFGDREAIIANNRSLASSLNVGGKYHFAPDVECSGIPVGKLDRLTHHLSFSAGTFIGFYEESYKGKLPPGSLIFQGNPTQALLANYPFYFGIDNLPGSAISPDKDSALGEPNSLLQFPLPNGFNDINNRRLELIEKELTGLTTQERTELERLHEITQNHAEKAFPYRAEIDALVEQQQGKDNSIKQP